METMEKLDQKKTPIMKHSLSNEKRLESLKLKNQLNKLQQNLIKSALAEIDSGKSVNKRKVFESDDEEDVLNEKVSNNNFVHSYNDKDKRQLFTDSDSDNSENNSNSKQNSNFDEDIFNIKPQFEGKKGQALLELQARFKSDQRFQLDKRFLDSDGDETDSVKDEQDKTIGTMDMATEREKNFEILQDVLGVQFPTQSLEKKLVKYRAVKDTSRLRYDPTREDAENFEIKRETKDQGSSKKKKQKMTDPEPVVLPEVSKEQFFEVATNLKDAFNDTSDNKTFSFLKEFNHHDNNDEEDDDNNNYFTEPISRLKPSSFERKVFKYDSSDNEDENISQRPPCKRLQGLSVHSQQNNSKSEWKFFFSADDPRLKEGVQYFQKSGTDEEIEEWWKKTRSTMLDLIQTKRKIYNRKTTVNRRRGKRGK